MLVYFAKGSDGVDVYQTEGTHTFSMNNNNYTFDCYMHVPCYLDTYNTSVMANRISVFNNKAKNITKILFNNFIIPPFVF